MRKQRAMQPVDERFWSKVNKNTESGCWEWTSSRNKGGYGLFFTSLIYSKQRANKAHRFSWTLVNGEIPDGMWVLHKCDNRKCVNPDHLFLGDRVANMVDCAAKGRNCKIGKSQITHCVKGHEFTAENTKLNSYGHRVCKQCAKDWAQQYKEQKKLQMRRYRAAKKVAEAIRGQR